MCVAWHRTRAAPAAAAAPEADDDEDDDDAGGGGDDGDDGADQYGDDDGDDDGNEDDDSGQPRAEKDDDYEQGDDDEDDDDNDDDDDEGDDGEEEEEEEDEDNAPAQDDDDGDSVTAPTVAARVKAQPRDGGIAGRLRALEERQAHLRELMRNIGARKGEGGALAGARGLGPRLAGRVGAPAAARASTGSTDDGASDESAEADGDSDGDADDDDDDDDSEGDSAGAADFTDEYEAAGIDSKEARAFFREFATRYLRPIDEKLFAQQHNGRPESAAPTGTCMDRCSVGDRLKRCLTYTFDRFERVRTSRARGVRAVCASLILWHAAADTCGATPRVYACATVPSPGRADRPRPHSEVRAEHVLGGALTARARQDGDALRALGRGQARAARLQYPTRERAARTCTVRAAAHAGRRSSRDVTRARSRVCRRRARPSTSWSLSLIAEWICWRDTTSCATASGPS